MGTITYQSVVGAPIVVQADDHWVQVVKDLDREEYNNEHAYHRQDRKDVKFCSLEVYNEHGNQEAGASPSVEDIICDRETTAEQDHIGKAVRELVDELITQLPEVQRAVFIAVHVEQRLAVEVAAERGVSKAAISKTLKKATEHVRARLVAAGVNSSVLHGLPMSGAHGNAQEGTHQ